MESTAFLLHTLGLYGLFRVAGQEPDYAAASAIEEASKNFVVVGSKAEAHAREAVRELAAKDRALLSTIAGLASKCAEYSHTIAMANDARESAEQLAEHAIAQLAEARPTPTPEDMGVKDEPIETAGEAEPPAEV